MLTKKSIRFIRQFVAPQRNDVLSLYLDIRPEKSENKKQATFIRAKDELKTLGLPKTFIEIVMDKIENAYVFSQARSLVLFASQDQEVFEHFTLPYALPFMTRRGVVAKFGQPYVLPLLQTLDSQKRYGVALLDEAHWRYFEIFFEHIEEVQDAFRPLNTQEWHELKEASRGLVVGNAARGGMGKDHFKQRKEAWTHRFYKHIAKEFERTLKANQVSGFFLMGLFEHTQIFKHLLGKATVQKLIDFLPAPSILEVSTHDIYQLVRPYIGLYEQGLEEQLLKKVTEEGIQGLKITLEALQAGRLQMVIAPFEYDQTVYLCSETLGLVADLVNVDPQKHYQEVRLQEVLPALVASHGARLTYIQKCEQEFLSRFGGLAGLKRW